MYTICLGNSSLDAYFSYSIFYLFYILFSISKTLLTFAFDDTVLELGGNITLFFDNLRKIVNDSYA